MKTCRNLYPRLCSFEDLYLAYRAARRGKRKHASVASFEFDQESELLRLQYFPSIDHTLLRGEIARLVRDEAVLDLCDRILASGVGVLSEEYEMQWFPGELQQQCRLSGGALPRSGARPVARVVAGRRPRRERRSRLPASPVRPGEANIQ